MGYEIVAGRQDFYDLVIDDEMDDLVLQRVLNEAAIIAAEDNA